MYFNQKNAAREMVLRGKTALTTGYSDSNVKGKFVQVLIDGHENMANEKNLTAPKKK